MTSRAHPDPFPAPFSEIFSLIKARVEGKRKKPSTLSLSLTSPAKTMGIEIQNTALNLVLSALGGFLGIYATLSFFIKERLFLGEAPLAVIVGIALERSGALPVELQGKPGSEEEPLDKLGLGISRIVIGIQLVLVGIQLPYKYPYIEFRSLFMLVVPVMAVMWLVTTGLTMLCVPQLPILAALVLASCATPTDPVLSNAIVKGSFADQHVSPRLRNLISAESGANDGLALPFLLLAVNLIKAKTTKDALIKWFIEGLLYEVGVAIVFGAVIGTAANRVLRWSARNNLIDQESFLCYGVAVGLFTVGMAGYFSLDDLLAAFVAGNALTWDDWYRRETEDDEIQNVLDLLLNTIFFTFVGATIPWESFSDLPHGLTPLRLLALCALVLAFRRLPALLVFYRWIPRIAHSTSETVFMGYFGPIGAGSIFYSALVLDKFDEAHAPPGSQAAAIRLLVKPLIYALVLSSLVGHTLAIPALKILLDWRGVGNIKLMGEEGDVPDDVSFAAPNDDARFLHSYRDGAMEESTAYSDDDDDDGGGEAEYEAGEAGAPGRPASEAGQRRRREEDESRRQQRRASSHDAGGGGGGGGGEIRERVPFGRLASTSSNRSSSIGAFEHDGTWNSTASWRLSSSHLPKTGHKLGPHVAREHQEQEEERQQRRRARGDDEENGPGRT